jgi:hypothetical protein
MRAANVIDQRLAPRLVDGLRITGKLVSAR